MFVYLKLPPAEQVGERTHVYSHIECDVEGCGERSPEASELMARHGLRGCGWHCAGGHHRCPKHVDTEAPRRDPQYREMKA